MRHPTRPPALAGGLAVGLALLALGALAVGVSARPDPGPHASLVAPDDAAAAQASPTRQAATSAGAEIVHRLTLHNGTDTDQSFSLTSEGGWPATLPAALSVSAGSTETLEVHVAVPFDAEDGAVDHRTVSATAEGLVVPAAWELISWTGGVFDGQSGYTGCRFDLDESGAIDEADLARVRDAFGREAGGAGYESDLDLNHDGRIGAADVQAVAGRLGSACAPTNEVDTSAMEEAVTVDAIREHLEALQAIGDVHDDNRATNTSGFDASVDFVVSTLADTGFVVSTPEYSYTRQADLAAPELQRIAPEPKSWPPDELGSFSNSGNGEVTAPVAAVDLVLPPGEDANASTSACEPQDFEGFPAGSIALIQRGTCPFNDKVLNALTAGAVGVLIFNEGQEGRQGPIASSLRNPVGVPVLGASFAVGEEIAGQLYDGSEVTLRLYVNRGEIVIVQRNVLAEWPHGDPERVVMSGSHLDSVPAGPGINDNGTGSATHLEIALQIAAADLRPVNRIRLAWWGSEEIGLIGSTAYVNQLSDAERDKIIAYLNYDMIGSPNWIRAIYDSNSEVFPPGSDEIDATLRRYYDRRELPHEPFPLTNRSDHRQFMNVGIPSGGLFTGAEGRKTAEQAEAYGGTVDEPRDPCYHRDCDTIDNVNFTILDDTSDAATHSVISFAMDPVFGYARLSARDAWGGSLLAADVDGMPVTAEGMPIAIEGHVCQLPDAEAQVDRVQPIPPVRRFPWQPTTPWPGAPVDAAPAGGER